jgi:hypothetical protein
VSEQQSPERQPEGEPRTVAPTGTGSVPRKIAGMVLAVGGVLVGLNALVSGPRAFGLGWMAVVGMCVAGVALLACGMWLLAGRSTPRDGH